ncbi:RES family NAD+ phosphorylase [Allopusillimonas ginsengisoli]|uniref:RES family NAD+ phosphorylase n=1 Tax=Allopusillimonas ginsengisoli TaxID=453575 RepID=UPI00101FAF12|nr:RES family NAD+ phosphorylase [Allopusillimonas ginsengisoli]TEA77162.1 RES domain-containing protein [Allopusillimonas ginsengisoli]
MTIWQACNGPQHIGPLHGLLSRLVESQEQIATMGYVDTLEEQAVLEALLEGVKPPYPKHCDGYHYLLKTPFRYPPLKWGSRFGRIHEPGIFYGGCSTDTTLAESAYYRFVFWNSMSAKPIKPAIHSQHTLFSVGYRTAKGIRLHNAPFDDHHSELTHPCSYHATQEVGTAMREAGVEAFEYSSARDTRQGRCVALFTPLALAQKTPRLITQWLCETRAQEVVFKQAGASTTITYGIGQFQVNGGLAAPATRTPAPSSH